MTTSSIDAGDSPVGATATDWNTENNGTTRGITGRDDVAVTAEAVQLGDGRIGAGPDGPTIFAEIRGSALTIAQAQQFATALLAAAADVQHWQSGGTGDHR